MKKYLIWLLASLMLFTACGDAITTDQSSSGDGNSQPEEEYTGETRYTLISTGKAYEMSAPANETYPDVYNQQLTDGQITPDEGVHYTDTRMVGFNQNTNFVIDLGDDGKRLSAVAVRALDFSGDGVGLPASIRVSASADGTSYKSIGTAVFAPTGEQTVSTARVELKEVTECRYVRVLVTKSANAHFFFIDEIQAFACVEDTYAPKTAELAYKSDETDRNAWKALSTGVEAKPAYTTNIAEAKKYTIEGFEYDWRTPEDQVAGYLTDAAHTGRLFGENVWVGLKGIEGTTPNITIGLTEVRSDAYAFKVHALGNVLDIEYPDYIDVYGASGLEYHFLGRMYAPAASNSFAYTLILPEYIDIKMIRFQFPEGTNTYWLEEIEIICGSDQKYEDQLYPDLDFEEVTEEVYWDASEPDYTERINLIQGVIQQVSCSTYQTINHNRDKDPSPYDFPYLTDGKRARETYCYSGEWFFAPNGGALEIVYDIGAISAVDSFNISLLEHGEWGVSRPRNMDVFLSVDGDTWYNVGSYDRPDDQIIQKSATRLEFPFQLETAYKARYVRFRIESAALFVDELECFGKKKAGTSTAKLEDGGFASTTFYINEESQQFATMENTGFAANDIAITYSNSTTREGLKAMLAYIDEDGNVKDTFMDGLLVYNHGILPSGTLLHKENRMTDWVDLKNILFTGQTGFDVIDEVVGEIKTELNLTDYTVKIYIPIPTVHDTITDFGDVDGDGVVETLTTTEERKKVFDWYLNLCISEFASKEYKNIELCGFYWANESVIWEKHDDHIITEAGECVHAANMSFFWVPYYVAHRYILGQEMGFDLVSMQPNYVFSLEYPYYRIFHTPEMALRYNMSVEIEHSYQCLSDPAFARRYMLYLYYGATTGYMNSVHVYYDDLENIGVMGLSDSPLCRMQYDATYHFAKGDLEITPETKEKFSLTATAETITFGNLSEADELAMFTLASCPENGNVSLNSDGSFAYYPAKGFTGTDTFTYTYNNYLGESEECVVEITVE